MQYETELKSIIVGTAGYIVSNYVEEVVYESSTYLESTSESKVYYPGGVSTLAGGIIMAKKDGLIKAFGFGMALSGVHSLLSAYQTKNVAAADVMSYVGVA